MDKIPIILWPETPDALEFTTEIYNVLKKLSHYDIYIVPDLPEWSNWNDDERKSMQDTLVKRLIDSRKHYKVYIISPGGIRPPLSF